ncbi:MAG TPA: L-threonine 3-dehydrogenase [Anaerolineales bacterium]|jgi:threonine 3-dehydrogenase
MKMKAVRKTRAEPGLDLVEIEVPRIQPDEVLVKVEATAICGTDVHFYNWDAFAQSKLKPPITLGHEFAGEIVEVGAQVAGYQLGDYVAADSHIVDSVCAMCRMGLQHICQNLKIFGNEVDGSFAEYVAVPETSLWRLSRDVPSEIGAIMEPLGGAVQAVLIEPVTAQNVVIFGDGPIGLFAVGVAKAAGARSVTMVGVIETRLEIAKQMGADRVFNNREGEVDPVEAIMQATGGLGADVVIEMSGAPQAFRQAFDTVRKGGRVSLFGISSDPMTFDFNYTVILRQVRVFGVAGRHMWDTWFMMDGLLASGKLDPRPVITCELKLEDFDKGFEQMVSKECGKVILRPFA